jgi:hypothetical protein
MAALSPIEVLTAFGFLVERRKLLAAKYLAEAMETY